MVYCTSDTLPLVEVRSGTKFTAPFGSAFTKCRRTSNGLKLQHTIKQVCLCVGSFPFWGTSLPCCTEGFGVERTRSTLGNIIYYFVNTYKTVHNGLSYRCFLWKLLELVKKYLYIRLTPQEYVYIITYDN